jgi:tetratricopeptide (TPR) repeat protein
MTSLSSPSTTGLKPLQRAFADYLRETNLYPGLAAIACSEQGGRLLLVAEHGAPEIDQPSELLRELEGAFRDLVPVVGLPEADWAAVDDLAVRIYLKLRSAPEAYAIHTFTWRPEDAAGVVFPPPAAGAQLEAAPPSPAQTGLGVAGVSGDGGAGNLPFSDAALALPEAAVQAPDVNPWADRGRQWLGRGARSLRYYWSYGLAALILVGSGAFAYALSRPCVVGSCDRLDQAAELAELAQVTLAGRPSGDELATAQLDLQTAIDLLTPVPTWSAHYGTAQADLQRYQGSIASLNALIQAQAIASEAASLSQNPPHPVERWVNVHLLWQQAIDRLGTIPADSPAFDFAQQKLREYRSNHSAIGRRIIAEEEAEANFNTAIQTGDLARQRTETANSLAGWQLATKEWQAAIKGLSLIPQGTMVYGEAQAQLKDYQQQLTRTTNRATLEEAGAHHYNQAIQAARAAAAYEAKTQWTLAVAQWRQAVASAQNIPRDTILAEEGAVLLETYQPALANAEGRLRTAVTLQNLTFTLAQMCEFSATPCTVREDASQVRVVVSSQYAEPLRQAITPPAADGTFAFTAQISPGAQQLIDQIISASHQVNRPVAIYDAQGGFVARYRPDLGGFIKN